MDGRLLFISAHVSRKLVIITPQSHRKPVSDLTSPRTSGLDQRDNEDDNDDDDDYGDDDDDDDAEADAADDDDGHDHDDDIHQKFKKKWVESKVQADLAAQENKLAKAKELAEAEQKKLKAQTAALEAQKLLNGTAATPTPHPNYAKPKLPPLTEFSQVDLYLQRFENYAQSMKWQPPDYASCLANLLQGEALSVFLSLSPEDISDYQSVKKTLLRRNCRRRQSDLSPEAHVVCSQQYNCCIADANFNRDGQLRIETASLFGRKCSLLRDTGCNTVGVRRSLVPASSITGRCIKVNTFCCKNKTFETAVIRISSSYFSGRVEACLLTDPVADVILGDIDGITHPTPFISHSGVDDPVPSACVVTRVQARKITDDDSQHTMAPSNDSSPQSQPIPLPLNFEASLPFTDVGSRQKVDPTLKEWFNKVGAPPVRGVYFTITDGKLLRHYQRTDSDIINTTLAVPESLGQLMLMYAHDTCLSGHSGFKKTLSNVQAYFSWPGLSNDVRCYTRSCHVCQVGMEFDLLNFGTEGIEMPSPSITEEDDTTTTAYVAAITEDSSTEFRSVIPTPSLSDDGKIKVNINPCLDSVEI
ncbi:reverse transcriptase [Elysia marginata]|uniref:Reverse transcriptase n=1 Tax=Elysia marginata TaxID=1093978 RepID=A0AAV4IF53_9GAST|nr:reverse transcriptase [Elysia marginata]